jgi:NAD(P)-dependent dehydrogenase (short-subunit alcohol dehydrogenase family)
MTFQNKVVIVTGAGHGIGRGIAQLYAKNGAQVVVADINSETGEQTVEEINNGYAGRAIFVKTDVKKPEEIINLMEVTSKTFGTVHILINNVGVSINKSIFDLSVEEWDEVLQTNLRSVFLCSREAAKYMRKNERGGAIVNLASTRATMSERDTEAYSASKGGILALTHALAISLGEHKITVNSISPGWIEVNHYESLSVTDHSQHPAGRVGTPGDIARTCLYLTNEENDFITGTNMIVDGGMTRKMIYEE